MYFEKLNWNAEYTKAKLYLYYDPVSFAHKVCRLKQVYLSLLNIKEKVYLFKSAHFIYYQSLTMHMCIFTLSSMCILGPRHGHLQYWNPFQDSWNMTGTTFMVTIVFLTPDFISQLSVDGFLKFKWLFIIHWAVEYSRVGFPYCRLSWASVPKS